LTQIDDQRYDEFSEDQVDSYHNDPDDERVERTARDITKSVKTVDDDDAPHDPHSHDEVDKSRLYDIQNCSDTISFE
jgi:hypothetical protein